MKNKKAQVWIETVIYTVIGLAIIGIVLAIATPAIGRYRDRAVIEQTISVLNDLDSEVKEVEYYGLGNRRPFEFRIKEGILEINSQEDKISYVLEESRMEYSELGIDIEQGDITIRTEKKGDRFDIFLSLSYEDINITYNKNEEKMIFQPTSTPYKIFIENLGGEKTNINIQ